MSNLRFAFILALLISVGVAAWPVVTQKSEYRGVTVAVTPGNLDPSNGIWDFAIAFDSARGAKLTDEVMENIVLVGDGRTMKPLAWEGEAAGGTHRAGVLKFIALKPRPKELEMHVQRPGEAKPRVFRFVFGDWAA
ncbi:hypothetical protein HHL11_16335 [Ramlibacter sp. G-1-2-2]|uniref:DUF4426 domain-containing protein n=1 Tax=Ramlibacter agri TaxID=2728837 RepID=A0A848HA18_9BURK|nr:hypothetical protein [Ramlibacter agri]NML45323.1 hypothetical protein [Ramlibacter agri]